MLNLRQIDKAYLSGGWEHVPKDLVQLKSLRIKAILDLQFIPNTDIKSMVAFISSEATKVGIEYRAIPMRDDAFNYDLAGIFETGHQYLETCEVAYPTKRDKILIKCGAGISRSPSMLIYHLCMRDRKSYVEALNYLRNKEASQYIQFGSSPNEYFAHFLREKFKDSTYA